MRAQSAGWPRTPSHLNVEQNRRQGSHHEVFGQSPRSYAGHTRGSRPGMATPRHLHSSVGDVIFGGGAWASPMPSTRGSAGGVGGARLHEVGHRTTPGGKQRRDHASTQQGTLLHHTFGAPPPERPTVGSRADLSRAHRHNDSTAHTIIFAHPIS